MAQEDVSHHHGRVVNCLNSVKDFILYRCCCCLCDKSTTGVVSFDRRPNFYVDRNDEEIIIRLPARPLYNIVRLDEDANVRNPARRLWFGTTLPDAMPPERSEPEHPRKKRMFSPTVDADTILQIKTALEENEPTANKESERTEVEETRQQNSEPDQSHNLPDVNNLTSISRILPSETSILCTLSNTNTVNKAASSSSSSSSSSLS